MRIHLAVTWEVKAITNAVDRSRTWGDLPVGHRDALILVLCAAGLSCREIAELVFFGESASFRDLSTRSHPGVHRSPTPPPPEPARQARLEEPF